MEKANARLVAEEGKAKPLVQKGRARPAAENPNVRSWAEVARISRPKRPTAAAASRVTMSRKIQLSNWFLRASKPSPEPVFFGGVQCRPVG